jgi:hypothetical protein
MSFPECDRYECPECPRLDCPDREVPEEPLDRTIEDRVESLEGCVKALTVHVIALVEEQEELSERVNTVLAAIVRAATGEEH